MGISFTTAQEALPLLPKWTRFQGELVSLKTYDNPIQDVQVKAVFNSPAGEEYEVDGFWDGGNDWKVRFLPDLAGKWTFHITCSDEENRGLHNLSGAFRCTAPLGRSALTRSGPVRVSRDRTHFVHEDGSPFFWMADTAWNGPLKSNEFDWKHYLAERRRQGFTAVQWVATSWRGAPDGDDDGNRAFEGKENIRINPAFFQRLDRRVESINDAGLLSVPVLLWAIRGAENPVNVLPDDQVVMLARYMVARWGATYGAWFFGGDGDYSGSNAARWRDLGQAVFGGKRQFPVFMYPKGKSWVFEEFRDEKWMTALGYQSGHDIDDATNNWIHHGPASRDWAKLPHRPVVNIEPAYEGIPSYSKKQPITAHEVRRALYWSLLNAPTAGVSYGAAGVWDWGDGDAPTPGHPHAGTPPDWRDALHFEAGEQIAHLSALFQSIEFQKLRPDNGVLAEQPGDDAISEYAAAASSGDRLLVLVYTPVEKRLKINIARLPTPLIAAWINPRTGERSSVLAVLRGAALECPAPGPGDWLLLLRSKPPEPVLTEN
ncbi:MAG: DUF4038 domain-containing protein [Verrucomicrobiota bacterium]|jgi:hypothetical protein|nr:DUF4038 domain-containing protein [Verrucomicrobiota bacterium]MDP7049865.1 DUF4038 domain-containing protein [Verrucomicrobiota bacterium]